MNNCSIHHIDEVTELLHLTGAVVHWLPPYSPDYSPIEVLSKAKTMMKAMEVQMQITQDIDTIVSSTVTPEDCRGWITVAFTTNEFQQ